MSPAVLPQRVAVPPQRWTRGATLVLVVVLHLFALLLLALYRAPPIVRTDDRDLTLVTVAPPPTETKPLLDPPKPTKTSSKAPTPQQIAGGSRDAGEPPPVAPLIAPPRPQTLDSVPTPRTPAASTAAAPTASPTPATGAGKAGSGNGTGSGLGAGDGTGNGNGDGSGTGGTRIEMARWVQLPTRSELNPYIRPSTLTRGISGQAFLACRVKLNAHVTDCRILKEVPQGSGFGAAAIDASPQFLIHPVTIDGRPIDRGWVLVPIVYNFVQ